jgi:HPC2 and ubinuclein domain
LTDPFIDDSELAIDERTFIAQTKQQGFYVFSGEVALLKEKSHRKPKSKKSALPAPEPIAGPSNYPHALINHGNHSSSSHSHSLAQQQPQQSSSSAKEVSIALLSDGEEAGEKRRTRLSAESPNGKKKRRVVDIVRIERPFF